MSKAKGLSADITRTRRHYWFALFRPVPMTAYDRELQKPQMPAVLAMLPRSRGNLRTPLGVTRFQAIRPITPMGVMVMLAGGIGLAIGITLTFFMGEAIQNLTAGLVVLAGVAIVLVILCRGRLDPNYYVEDYDEARDAERRASGKEPWLDWTPNQSGPGDRRSTISKAKDNG